MHDRPLGGCSLETRLMVVAEWWIWSFVVVREGAAEHEKEVAQI